MSNREKAAIRRLHTSLKYCTYCGSANHQETKGWISVVADFNDGWYCSYQCLHSEKYGSVVYGNQKGGAKASMNLFSK